MTNTIIVLIARMGSSRLKDKHLMDVNGHPILDYLLKRISFEFQPEILNGDVKVVIASPNDNSNKRFNDFFSVDVFLGSEKNIPLRLLEAAQFFNASNVISIDGDDIFCSPKAMREVIEVLNKGECEHVVTEGLPLGMNVSGFTSGYLEKSIQGYEKKPLETGWGRIFNEKDIFKLSYPVLTQLDIRLTLDYLEDYLAFKNLIINVENFESCTDQEIVSSFIQNEFYKINESKKDIYWDNFQKEKNAEAYEV